MSLNLNKIMNCMYAAICLFSTDKIGIRLGEKNQTDLLDLEWTDVEIKKF